MEKNVIKKRKRLIIVLLIVLALLSGLYAEMFVLGPKRLDITTIEISDAKIPASFNDSKILVISDVYGDIEALKRAQKAVNDTSPDFIVFLGNLLEPTSDEAAIKEITAILKSMNAPLGKYAVLGSNDVKTQTNQLTTIFNDAEFRLTINQSVEIHRYQNDTIAFSFLDNNNLGGTTLQAAIEALPAERFVLGFTNNPKTIDSISESNLSVLIAGETGLGKVNIPFYGPFFNRDNYTKQDQLVGKVRLLITAGIHTNEPNIRFFANPDVLLIKLRSSQ